MVKPIHARQGNSLAIGRHAAPGRVPCKKTEMFDYPSGFLPRQKATSPDKGRHEMVRTRRTGVGAVRGGRLQDLRR